MDIIKTFAGLIEAQMARNPAGALRRKRSSAEPLAQPCLPWSNYLLPRN